MKRKLHIVGQDQASKKKQLVALMLTAKDDADLGRIWREGPDLADISIDPSLCDILFRIVVAGKAVLNIRLHEDDRAPSVLNALRTALENAKLTHLIVDGDPWYSCPKSGQCADEKAVSEGECNCGADTHNEKIDKALKG